MKTREFVTLLWIGLQLGCSPLSRASAQSIPPSTKTASGAAKPMDLVSPENAGKQELDEILKELREIRALLEKQQAQLAELGINANKPAKIEMTVGNEWHVIGNTNAPVMVVEFTDLQCPFCHQFENGALPALKTDYIDTGQIRFVSLDLPLSMHSYAEQAAEAVQCAGDQGKFWELRTALFRRPEPPTRSIVLESARSLGIDLQQL